METQYLSLKSLTLAPINLNFKSVRKAAVLSALFSISLLYQNFSFKEGFKVSQIPLNEQARASHARELLGNQYSGSAAQMVENSSGLNMAILNEVYENLPKAYKSAAIDLSSTILKEAEKHKIDPVFALAIIKTESGFNPLALGSHGEIGLMQLKPSTAEWIANKYGIPWKGKKSLENPRVNVRIGLAYFDYLRSRFEGHANKYVSAYNMGAAKVSKMYENEQKPREYSLRVMKNYRDTYRRLAAATAFNLVAGN